MTTTSATPAAKPLGDIGTAVKLRWPWSRDKYQLSFPYSIAALIGLIVFWQIGVVAFSVPDYLLPSPSGIARDISLNWKVLLRHAGITTLEVVTGFSFSLVVGIPLAALFTYSRGFERAVFPLLVGSNTIPKVALAPLFLAWFGFGLQPKILIVALVTIFPIVINSVVGLKSLSPQMLYLAHSMGATPAQIFWHFRFPNALPSIFAGLKVATSLSVIGAVVAEFVGADGGLGYVMMIANADLNIARQFSAILVLSIIGISFFTIIAKVEKLLLPWHVSVRNYGS
jgi:NitT/TauT family transport system permease protein